MAIVFTNRASKRRERFNFMIAGDPNKWPSEEAYREYVANTRDRLAATQRNGKKKFPNLDAYLANGGERAVHKPTLTVKEVMAARHELRRYARGREAGKKN
ncbi:MAG: hypothetical protein NUV67_04585 [archaeon]|nr:hypothetical protein [archaeon]